MLEGETLNAERVVDLVWSEADAALLGAVREDGFTSNVHGDIGGEGDDVKTMNLYGCRASLCVNLVKSSPCDGCCCPLIMMDARCCQDVEHFCNGASPDGKDGSEWNFWFVDHAWAGQRIEGFSHRTTIVL